MAMLFTQAPLTQLPTVTSMFFPVHPVSLKGDRGGCIWELCQKYDVFDPKPGFA